MRGHCGTIKNNGRGVRHDVEDDNPITADQLPAGLTPTPEGWFRSDPGMLAEQGGIDGFFAAMWGK